MTNAVYIKTPAKPNSYTYSYYQNDHLGTPQQLLSFNSATVWQGEYDAFGEISITNNQIPQPLRFAGQYHDSESNLYYNWHRYYNPKLGRYISSDPIGLDGGMNRFGYVYQNTNVFVDIDGEVPLYWVYKGAFWVYCFIECVNSPFGFICSELGVGSLQQVGCAALCLLGPKIKRLKGKKNPIAKNKRKRKRKAQRASRRRNRY